VAKGLRLARVPGFTASWLSFPRRFEAGPKARSLALLDAYPAIEELSIEMGALRNRRSNLDPMEQFSLAAICAIHEPKTILEIGTYDGTTTMLLAKAAPRAKILTLDLPEAEAGTATVAEEASNVSTGGIGRVFAGTAEAPRITQLLGDSRRFDFSAWFDSIDLVLIDGGHDADCAVSDTRNALRLIRDGGVVVWDDYTEGWPGVVHAVDTLPANTRRHVVRLEGTQFAVLDPTLCTPGSQ
jgi:predicted O-methyltransferase YrrM